MSQQGQLHNVGSGGAVVETLTGNVGGPVGPDASFNINIVGNAASGINVIGTPGTNTLTIVSTYYSLTPFIVGTDNHSQYSTIQSAITAAVAAGASSTSPANIYIKPKNSGYTENPVLQDGINLIGFNGPTRVGTSNLAPQIHGKITFSGAGAASIIGVGLNTNGDYLLELTGGSSVQVYVLNSFLSAVDFNAIHCTNSSGIIYMNNTNGYCGNNTFFVATAGEITADYCQLASNNTVISSTFANANFGGRNSFFSFPITTTASATLSLTYTELISFNTIGITHNSTASSFMRGCRVESGTANCVSIGAGSTLPIITCEFNSSNANVLTGAGTMNYSFISFTGISSGHNVAVENAYATLI